MGIFEKSVKGDIGSILNGIERHPADKDVGVENIDYAMASFLMLKRHLKVAFINADNPVSHMGQDETFELMQRVHNVSRFITGDKYEAAGVKHKRNYGGAQAILDFTRYEGRIYPDASSCAAPDLVEEKMADIPKWLIDRAQLTSDILAAAFPSRLYSPITRIRTTMPNSGHKGLIPYFHAHGLSVQSAISGARTQWIAGEVKHPLAGHQYQDVSSNYETRLPWYKAAMMRDRIHEIPENTIAIFGKDFFHRTSPHVGKDGQFVIESLMSKRL